MKVGITTWAKVDHREVFGYLTGNVVKFEKSFLGTESLELTNEEIEELKVEKFVVVGNRFGVFFLYAR